RETGNFERLLPLSIAKGAWRFQGVASNWKILIFSPPSHYLVQRSSIENAGRCHLENLQDRGKQIEIAGWIVIFAANIEKWPSSNEKVVRILRAQGSMGPFARFPIPIGINHSRDTELILSLPIAAKRQDDVGAAWCINSDVA